MSRRAAGAEREDGSPSSYQEGHEIALRRLAAFTVQMAAQMHMALGHGESAREYASRADPMRHSWRLCRDEPCIHVRLVLEGVGCSEFILTRAHEMGTREERRQARASSRSSARSSTSQSEHAAFPSRLVLASAQSSSSISQPHQ